MPPATLPPVTWKSGVFSAASGSKISPGFQPPWPQFGSTTSFSATSSAPRERRVKTEPPPSPGCRPSPNSPEYIAESCTLSSIRECGTLPAARGLATQRLTPRAVSAKEIVMRPSRLLVVMFVSLVTPLALAPSSHAQTVTTLYSFSGTNSSGNPGLVVPSQGRDGKLYGTT